MSPRRSSGFRDRSEKRQHRLALAHVDAGASSRTNCACRRRVALTVPYMPDNSGDVLRWVLEIDGAELIEHGHPHGSAALVGRTQGGATRL